MAAVYLLGGYQTDFAQNWAEEGITLFDAFKNTLFCGLEQAQLDPSDLDVAHVGNFSGELFCGQGHLGGFAAACDPALAELPGSRHEGACASGSLAALAAGAAIEAGRYHCAAVMGIEQMRNVRGRDAIANISGPAMLATEEYAKHALPWPNLFNHITDEYARRYGEIDYAITAKIAEINYANAKDNPNAYSREWGVKPEYLTNTSEANPEVTGRLHKFDCARLADGASVAFLASEDFAKSYAKKRGIPFDSIPKIKGWGHRNAPITFDAKLEKGKDQPLVFPHIKNTIDDALRRAGLGDVHQLGALELHDCFTPTEYMLIDHLGITAPGESYKAIEAGVIEKTGSLPVNPSGGLLGQGHPVGATGVRMLVDCYKQVTGTAGAAQINDLKDIATVNIGGSTTTVCSLVVGL